MLIEMCGPSAAGKSTILSRAIQLEDAKQGRAWLAPSDVDENFEVVPSRARLASADTPAASGLMDVVFSALADSRMLPSQRLRALQMVMQSVFQSLAVEGSSIEQPLVHDELIMNRAFSVISHSKRFEEWTERYFRVAPAPAGVIIVSSEAEVLRDHIVARSGPSVNVYRHLAPNSPVMDTLLEALRRMSEIASEVLRERGVNVLELDSARDVAYNAESMTNWIDHIHKSRAGGNEDSLRGDLLAASGTFRKGSGRHTRRHRRVAYSSFVTSRFSVLPGYGQRNAEARFKQLGLNREILRGKRVLDLGSNTGAMLLHASNYGISSGVGLEYDRDKVLVSQRIAEKSAIQNLSFREGDIEQISSGDLGKFDVVFCLAVEGHVLNRPRLLDLLRDVTSGVLCFEGNGGTGPETIVRELRETGFERIVHLGFSTDDVDPRNHKRPVLRADRI